MNTSDMAGQEAVTTGQVKTEGLSTTTISNTMQQVPPIQSSTNPRDIKVCFFLYSVERSYKLSVVRCKLSHSRWVC